MFDLSWLFGSAHRALPEALPLGTLSFRRGRHPSPAMPGEAALVKEVRALVTHLRELDEAQVVPQDPYHAHSVRRAFAVWEAWLADPAHPQANDLTWLREWVRHTGEFHVQTEGADPLPVERRVGLDLIDRMLAAARARRWGASIRERREARGLSQRAVALALKVTETTVWRWEHGAPLSTKHREQLAKLLGGHPGDYDGDDEPDAEADARGIVTGALVAYAAAHVTKVVIHRSTSTDLELPRPQP